MLRNDYTIIGYTRGWYPPVGVRRKQTNQPIPQNEIQESTISPEINRILSCLRTGVSWRTDDDD